MTTHKRWIALLMALCLMLPGLQALAEEAPRGAFVLSPNDKAVSLCNYSDDYEAPAAVYFDGVRVRVHKVEKGLGAYPAAISDPDELWAYVSIDTGEDEALINGWTVNIALQYDGQTQRSAPPLPRGELRQAADLYLDNGQSDTILGHYPEATPVELLGISKAWQHVRIAGATGFIKPGLLRFDAANQRLVDAAMPKAGFDEIGLGHYGRYEDYQAKSAAIMGGQTREAAELDLATRAKLSQLAQRMGFTYMDVINDLPGDKDLSEKEATDLGWAALKAHFEYDEADISRLSAFFYHLPDKPDERFWRVYAYARYNKPNVSVVLDTAGKPLDYVQGEPYGSDDDLLLSADDLRQAQQHIHYYIDRDNAISEPPEGTIGRQEAIDKAWERFLAGGEGRSRENGQLVSARYHSRPQDGTSWWMVKIMDKEAPIGGPVWYAAVLGQDGEDIISSDNAVEEAEQSEIQSQRDMAALVSQRGPFEIWDLEQKVEIYPFVYREPKEGDLPQAEVMGLAREAIKKHLFASDEALDGLKLVVSLTTEDVWRVEYYEHELKDGQAVCRYAAALSSLTGEVIEVIADAPIGNG